MNLSALLPLSVLLHIFLVVLLPLSLVHLSVSHCTLSSLSPPFKRTQNSPLKGLLSFLSSIEAVSKLYSNTPSDFDFKLESLAQGFRCLSDFVQHLAASVDIVFPVIHGPFGEDGTLQVLAFRVINPQAPVHILIIPKVKDGLTRLAKLTLELA
ncbi:uncharacterized protein LOC110727121 isoform X3 [Chenopodium quinoa]|uniref:uncharacterized protein LOC110727121 isoform X3 n=1 Tax=Chenopodium quinoa TaxID=63459 RepID=UPI000B77FE2D|nr:uncharacterized protein LOC110727121 isoform X3 [Chenopodium quinoa]